MQKPGFQARMSGGQRSWLMQLNIKLQPQKGCRFDKGQRLSQFAYVSHPSAMQTRHDAGHMLVMP